MKHRSHTFLIVDDNEDDQMLDRLALVKSGVSSSVNAVDSADQAIDYIEGNGRFADRNQFPFPSFMILDLKMNLASGFKVLKYLKEHPDYSIIPTIVMSSSDDLSDVNLAYKLGASSYIKKPCDFKTLINVFNKISDYWYLCEVPMVGPDGRMLQVSSDDKLSD